MDLFKTKLREEATCSICLEFYIDPVLLDCGHNFCRCCINRCWMEFPTNPVCPQCRKAIPTMSCRPNRSLANVVEILKNLNSQEKEEGEDKPCKKHSEPSEIVFCKDDKVSLCLACEGSEEHRSHHLVSLKEAAQEYKDSFYSHVQALQSEKREILAHKLNAIRENEESMKLAETEKQKTLLEFRQLQQFLADQESFLLTKIQVVGRDLASQKNEQLCQLSAELFSLQNAIQRLEERCLEADNNLLKDAEKTLEDCKKKPKIKLPKAIPLQLKWRTWELCEFNVLLEGAAAHFKNTLQYGIQPREANVILDPESAHSQLVLSSDGKSVRWTETEQDVPETPKRFKKQFCVMGCQQFTAGRHFWDVTVEGQEDWAVGVATSSVDRKAFHSFTAEAGFFAMGKPSKEYRPPSFPEQNEDIKKIRIFLNCTGGRLVFYNAETAKKLYSFTHTSIQRETLQAFFWLRGDARLRL
ncbi:E3 ubiquitin-protein ligase TRIM7-like [Paroedura picta]|uniref:E3 ubiquitin-protein ligase TRIM7-like n=1 Tax=Paroedura picta TaxID=143630 RepID=UPI004055E7CB